MQIPANLTTIPAPATTAMGEQRYRDTVAQHVVWALVNVGFEGPEFALDAWEVESNVQLTDAQRKSIIDRIEW